MVKNIKALKIILKGEMVAELTEIDPTRETAYNCVRSMAVAFIVSVMSAILLIIIAIIVLFVIKRFSFFYN